MRRPLKPLSGEEFSVEGLMPRDTPQYMFESWASCLHWSISEPAILNAFREDTGITYQVSTDPLKQMIDLASGASTHFLRAYIKWFNINVWGPVDGGMIISSKSKGRKHADK